MTRRDYETIALAIRRQVDALADTSSAAPARCSLRRLTGDLAVAFTLDNPRFNAGRFAGACGFPTLTEEEATR